MKKTVSILLSLIMIFSCLTITAGAVDYSADIKLNGTTYSFVKNSTLTYKCDLKVARPVYNGQFEITYPENILQITNVEFPVIGDDMVYNYQGSLTNQIKFNFSNAQESFDFSKGDNLVTVTFNVINTGDGEINFDAIAMGESLEEDIVDLIPDSVFTEKLSGKVYKTPKISQTKRNLYVKKAFQLTVKNGSPDSKVTWKSSNTKIATVKNGKVTAKKAGTVTITATKDGVALKCKVVVKNPTVKAKASTIKVKKSTTITVKNAVGKTKFKSLTSKIAKVNAKGKVTGLKKGNAKIQVIASGVKFTVKIKVK